LSMSGGGAKSASRGSGPRRTAVGAKRRETRNTPMKNTAPEPEMQLSVKSSRREDKTRGPVAKDKESDVEQAADPTLTEDLALALLARNTLSVEAIAELSKNASLSSARKVRVGMVVHPRTPRHTSLKLLRLLPTFDLMRVALLPVMSGDLKRV